MASDRSGSESEDDRRSPRSSRTYEDDTSPKRSPSKDESQSPKSDRTYEDDASPRRPASRHDHDHVSVASHGNKNDESFNDGSERHDTSFREGEGESRGPRANENDALSLGAEICVKIFRAWDLQASSHLQGALDPFCVCRLMGASAHDCSLEFQTPTQEGAAAPEWNYTKRLTVSTQINSFEFEVFDGTSGLACDSQSQSQGSLGKASLSASRIDAHGFKGNLKLLGDAATGTVSVEVSFVGDGVPPAHGDHTAPTACSSHGSPVHTASHTLQVTILHAQGLRNAEWFGTSDPYCTCQTAGVKEQSSRTSFSTQPVSDCLDPVWKHTGEIADFEVSDSLEFHVLDKNRWHDASLGTATLQGSRFGVGRPFEGALKLAGSRHAQGTLTVRVEVETHADDQLLNADSLDLAAMIRPDHGEPEKPQTIWDKVVHDGARLPGKARQWDASPSGALDAARCGDWGLCAYLAAKCFVDRGGGQAGAACLASVDERCQNTLWLEVVAPILVEVPRGSEWVHVQIANSIEPEWVRTDQLADSLIREGKVWVRRKGLCALAASDPSENAQHFKVGSMVKLTQVQSQRQRFHKYILSDEERLELRHVFLMGKDAPVFLHTDAHCEHVSSSSLHTLAYPFAGDFTKALLRPGERAWTKCQRSAAERAVRFLGETLISQCAKAGQWALVETLLRAGVPCPDLTREFQHVCGYDPRVTENWCADLMSTAGHCFRHVLEMAVALQGPQRNPRPIDVTNQSQNSDSSSQSEAPPVKGILEALDGQGSLPDLNRPSVVVAAAKAGNWDAVRSLLVTAPEFGVSAVPLLSLQSMLHAPVDVLEEVQRSVRREKADGLRARTLQEYFQRKHAGEVMDARLAPRTVSSEGDVLTTSQGSRVLDCLLRLGVNTYGVGVCIAFASISEDELATLQVALDAAPRAMLPIDLSNRLVALEERTVRGGCWLPLMCMYDWLQPCRQRSNNLMYLRIPRSCMPMPHVRTIAVQVAVVTPCCGQPLAEVQVHVDGRRVGVTDHGGEVRIHVLHGRHVFTIPKHSHDEEVVDLTPGLSEAPRVHMAASGELIVYLVPSGFEDDVKDAVMLCTNPDVIAEEARPFEGTVQLPESINSHGMAAEHHAFNSGVCVAPGRKCSEALCKLRAQSDDGRRSEPNEEMANWFETFAEDCQVAMLFKNPQRLGNLLGKPVQRAKSSQIRPQGPAASTPAPSERLSQDWPAATGPRGKLSSSVPSRPGPTRFEPQRIGRASRCRTGSLGMGGRGRLHV